MTCVVNAWIFCRWAVRRRDIKLSFFGWACCGQALEPLRAPPDEMTGRTERIVVHAPGFRVGLRRSQFRNNEGGGVPWPPIGLAARC
jgi:hypothetical protein